MRAERSLVENGPNPVMETVSPAARVSEMVTNMAPTAVSASVLDMEVGAATRAHSSGLFILLGVGLKLSTPGVPRTVYAGTRYAVAGHIGPVGANFITKCRISASSFV